MRTRCSDVPTWARAFCGISWERVYDGGCERREFCAAVDARIGMATFCIVGRKSEAVEGPPLHHYCVNKWLLQNVLSVVENVMIPCRGWIASCHNWLATAKGFFLFLFFSDSTCFGGPRQICRYEPWGKKSIAFLSEKMKWYDVPLWRVSPFLVVWKYMKNKYCLFFKILKCQDSLWLCNV